MINSSRGKEVELEEEGKDEVGQGHDNKGALHDGVLEEGLCVGPQVDSDNDGREQASSGWGRPV